MGFGVVWGCVILRCSSYKGESSDDACEMVNRKDWLFSVGN